MEVGGSPHLALYFPLYSCALSRQEGLESLSLRVQSSCQVRHLVDGMQQGVQYCSLCSCILSNMTMIYPSIADKEDVAFLLGKIECLPKRSFKRAEGWGPASPRR